MCLDVPAILMSVPSRNACERLAEEKPDCRCEIDSVQPDLSPGIVQPSEELARFVSPQHFDAETGSVKSSLFSHAGTSGMSVTRIAHAGREGLASQQERKDYIGYVSASCGSIRELRFEIRRMFCVYDTAKADNRAHADVCQAVFRPRSQQSDMRRTLQRQFTRSPASALPVR